MMKRILVAMLAVWFAYSFTDDEKELLIKHDKVVFYGATQVDKSTNSDVVKHYKVLQIQNTSNKLIRVSWRLEKYYDGHCSSCNQSAENFYSILIQPNGSVSGEAKDKASGLKVFQEFENGYPTSKKLTELKIVDIDVKVVNN